MTKIHTSTHGEFSIVGNANRSAPKKPKDKRKPPSKRILKLLYPHSDNCGWCEYNRLSEKYLLPHLDGKRRHMKKASDRLNKQWRNTKYYKFAQKCMAQGLDWQEEFKKRGWEP